MNTLFKLCKNNHESRVPKKVDKLPILKSQRARVYFKRYINLLPTEA